MMKNTNIILVTDVPPDAKYTAGQVLYRVMSKLPEYNFSFHWLNQSNLDGRLHVPKNCKLTYEYATQHGGMLSFSSRVVNYLGRRLPRFNRLLLFPKILIYFASLIFTAILLSLRIRKEKAGMVWFVVQGDKLVFCYLLAAKFAKKPYVVQQWDPLSWWMGHRQYPLWFQNFMKRLLSRLESGAYLNIVPSDAWKDLLVAQQKRAIRLDNFIEQSLFEDDRFIAVREPGVFHAVFLGQFYANTELTQLVSSLVVELSIHKKSLVVHYFGSSQPIEIPGCRFVAHGYLDRNELIRNISQWELALLPYPTKASNEETARLSFPSKSRVYMAAGLPILALAPAVSGVHVFLKKIYEPCYHNIVTDNDIGSFLSYITEFDYQSRKSQYKTARMIVKQQFSDIAELEPFKIMLGEIM